MVSSDYRQAFKSAIARIYHTNGRVVGAGFLVADGQLLTCAHVVTAALGLPETTQEAPAEALELDFPLIAPGQKVKAKVIFWRPVRAEPSNPSETGEDMAGLALESSPSLDCQPVRLVTAADLWAHPFQIFGFPSQRDEGIWASGVIRDRLANGWVQIEDIKAQGHSVQPGFSGAPLWDEQVKGVVGMAVAADKKRDETKTAFMIPTSLLCKAWTALELSTQLAETPEPALVSPTVKDFFISYNRADKQWAEWLAWTLEESGYSVVIQAWHFRPGGNFVLDMQRAAAESQKTIAVLSEAYLKSSYTQPEWAAAFASDPQALERKLLPVRVQACQPEGMLRSITYVDLVALGEVEAQQAVLAAIKPSGKPAQKPIFPGKEATARVAPIPVAFPGLAVEGVESAYSSKVLSEVNHIFLKSKQEDLAAKRKQHDAVAKQLWGTVDPDIGEKFSLKLENLEAEMHELAQAIDNLSGGGRAE